MRSTATCAGAATRNPPSADTDRVNTTGYAGFAIKTFAPVSVARRSQAAAVVSGSEAYTIAKRAGAYDSHADAATEPVSA